jgi:hypothetical protein
MRQYLAEGVAGAYTFTVDRTKTPVTESRPNSGSVTRIPGRLSVCDCVNGNNRRYGKRVWEKNLAENSPLMESIKRNRSIGLLEHPDDGRVTLLSPISHMVTDAKMVESKDDTGKIVYEVVGEISLFNTVEGQKLAAMIEGGYNPLVSSRGYGSLVKAPDGVDEVQEDYVCESWDVVFKPSFETAELTPNRGGEQLSTSESAKGRDQKVVTEAAPAPAPAAPQPTLETSSPSGPASGASANAKPQPVRESRQMKNITEIKSRISALRSVNPANDPQRFAESMAEAQALHVEIDQYIAEDQGSRSYSGKTLHSDIERLTKHWQESVQAPARQAKRLSENQTRLLKVIAATAKTGVEYKGKLGEALTNLKKSSKLNEELVRRGQGWRELAESRKQKLLTTEHHFDTACEALDIMTERYHKDTVELARRVIQLEFAEKAQTPEIQKALKEATRLKQIAAIRETLEGKPAAAPAEGTPAPAPAATTESKTPSAAPAAAAQTVTESKTPASPSGRAPLTEASTITLSSNLRDPRNLNESVEMVRRLSATTAK